MKNYLSSLLIMLLCSLSACGQDVILDELDDPRILRSTEIESSSSHLAFPSIEGNSDRSRIVLVYREGTEHASFDGKLIQMESFDKGKTWTNRRVIYQVDSCDARDPQLFAISDSKLLCRFFERQSETVSYVRASRSEDFGETYSSIATFPFPTESETFAAARGNMVMVDGIIYSVCYNRWAQSWMEVSEDEGRTWKVVSWIDESLGTEKSVYSRVNEASLGYIDGTMYLVARTNSSEDEMQVATSYDLGATWSWEKLPVKGQAPSLVPYKDGFILTYRLVDNDAKTYDFQIALMKDGQLYTDPISLFVSKSVDIGYGDVLTLENSFLVCCYQPNKIKCYEISYDIFE